MTSSNLQTRLQKSLGCSRQFLLSGLEEGEKRELSEKIVGLGAVYVQSETYKPACTHLICGRLSRSEKFLCACAQGRWVLHPNYINDSAKEGKWLPEENYEWVNFSDCETREMGETARRWRFHVEAFLTLPFSGWKVAVIVRGSRKSSIYTRLLSCGGAEVYRLTLPVGNKSRVANLLTYVFVGERNVSEAQHLIEFGIMCLRPEFIGDYILKDPPPDPLDYLVRQDMTSSPKVNRPVDIDDSITDIQFSQSTSVGSASSSPRKFITITPRGSPLESSQTNSLTPSGSPLVNSQTMSLTLRGSPGLRSQTKSLTVSPAKKEDATCPVSEPGSTLGKNKGKKRKRMADLDQAVQQIKRSKIIHRGDLWQPSEFTGMPEDSYQEEEISTPFPKHLEGIILAFFEEDGGDPRFFLSGLDLVMSSTSDRQFPTTRIIRGIRDRLFQVQTVGNEMIQYRCCNVLMKILNLHPPIRSSVTELYLSMYKDLDEGSQSTVIGSLVERLNEADSNTIPESHILLLRCVVAALEVNLQYFLNRIETGDMNVRKLRGCLFSQMVWPGNTILSVNSHCKEILDLFHMSIAEDTDSSSKRELVRLSTNLVCMAVLMSHYMESGHRVGLLEPINASITASALLHEVVRHVPNLVSSHLLRTVLRSLTPPWIAVQFCCLLLRNLDDYLLLQDLPAKDVTLKEIVTKYFFLLPKIESRQSSFHQSSHPKRSVLRSNEDNRTRGKRVLQDKHKEQSNHVSVVKEVNKRNNKGETPLQVACIKNNTKKVRQLLKVPGVDVNTCDNAGWSPLHEACNLGHLEIVRELLNFIPAKTMDHFLGQGGDKKPKKVNLLVATEDQITPLHDAVMNNRLEIAKLLLQHGGPALLECRTTTNQTPLDLAVTSQMKELLLSFTGKPSSQSCSQGSACSDSPSDLAPSDYLYDQVLGQEDRGFADPEECAKYISIVTTLLQAYLKVMDYNRVQALMEGQSDSCVRDVQVDQHNEKLVVQNVREDSSNKCQGSFLNGHNLVSGEPRNSVPGVSVPGVSRYQQDYRTACKLSVYVQRFVDHIQRITRTQDFQVLKFDLVLLQQMSMMCGNTLK